MPRLAALNRLHWLCFWQCLQADEVCRDCWRTGPALSRARRGSIWIRSCRSKRLLCIVTLVITPHFVVFVLFTWHAVGEHVLCHLPRAKNSSAAAIRGFGVRVASWAAPAVQRRQDRLCSSRLFRHVRIVNLVCIESRIPYSLSWFLRFAGGAVSALGAGRL